MSALATIRPDSWNFPLFVHVLGAMILVGGLLTGASSLAFARGDARFLRLGYRSLLAVALPGWILMRVGAEWIASREGWTKKGAPSPTWLDIGVILADAGGLILLVSLIVGGFGVRRMRAGKGAGLLKATLVLSIVLLGAYLVAVWAMAGKPS
jgi:ABC-type maltose transport system permease subunit